MTAVTKPTNLSHCAPGANNSNTQAANQPYHAGPSLSRTNVTNGSLIVDDSETEPESEDGEKTMYAHELAKRGFNVGKPQKK
ncbi:hypothetical protein JVU11DRAFT_10848 [Chiua virens]|nr:hypothetical protein JVU11DRAFT_10848 [Chiua virens]